jgi:hypothetical protein
MMLYYRAAQAMIDARANGHGKQKPALLMMGHDA